MSNGFSATRDKAQNKHELHIKDAKSVSSNITLKMVYELLLKIYELLIEKR